MQPFTQIEKGALRVRRLTDNPQDVATLSRWLSDPRVLEFYEGRDRPFDEEAIRTKFIAKLQENETPCIVEYEGQPVGYLQFYPLDDEGYAVYGYPRQMRVFGMDQFVGLPELWGTGVGTRMVRLVLSYLFEVEQAERVVLDPVVSNARAIRSYEKCGFRKVKIIPQKELHEGVWHDSWQMEVTPETFTTE